MAKKKPTKRAKPRPKGGQAKKPAKRRVKRHIKLMVIPEPKEGTRSVLRFTGDVKGPVMRGPGNVIMECGNCGTPLLDGIGVKNVQNLVFVCPKCKAFNETLA